MRNYFKREFHDVFGEDCLFIPEYDVTITEISPQDGVSGKVIAHLSLKSGNYSPRDKTTHYLFFKGLCYGLETKFESDTGRKCRIAIDIIQGNN